MASNSQAVLMDRVKELGLDDIIPQLEAKGWTTQGTIAFATTYTPTQPNDDLLMEQFIKPIIQEDAAKVPLMRRLWFECYSATMIEIKQRVSPGQGGSMRKLTQPELTAKRAEIANKLKGINLEGELDVSDDLINAFANMAHTQVITYVGIEKATKRVLGIEGVATDPHIVKDQAGALREIPAPRLPNADTSSELRAELAMQRLSLAADMGGVLSYEKHEEMRLAFQRARLEDPPNGFNRITSVQVKNAHKEFWNQLSILSKGKVAPVGGVKPLDAFVTGVLGCRQVQACLMYLPNFAKAGGQPAAGSQEAAPKEGGQPAAGSQRMTKGGKRRKQLEKVAEQARAQERAKYQRTGEHQNTGSSGGAKGGGKGQRKGGNPTIPRMLLTLGCTARTPRVCTVAQADEPICFSYNLPGGCPNAQPGGRCGRGLHVCAKCYQSHSATSNH